MFDIKNIEKMATKYFNDENKNIYLSEMCLALNIANAAEIFSVEI